MFTTATSHTLPTGARGGDPAFNDFGTWYCGVTSVIVQLQLSSMQLITDFQIMDTVFVGLFLSNPLANA